MSGEQAGDFRIGGTRETPDPVETLMRFLENAHHFAAAAAQQEKRLMSPGIKITVFLIKAIIYTSIFSGLAGVLYGSYALLLVGKPLATVAGGWSLMLLATLLFKTLSK